MSNAVFPALPGIAYSVTKAPTFSTVVAKNAAGKEVRVALWQDPIWKFELPFEFLRDDPNDSAYLINGQTELDTLMGFVVARQGSFDSFLYLDPTDNQATAQATIPATGDGSNKAFQLARQRGGNGYSETIQNINGTPTVYVAGVAQSGSAYTLSSTGLITFTTAPTIGQAVTWTGGFYFRCRFTQDESDFENWMNLLWKAQKIEFQSVKL